MFVFGTSALCKRDVQRLNQEHATELSIGLILLNYLDKVMTRNVHREILKK